LNLFEVEKSFFCDAHHFHLLFFFFFFFSRKKIFICFSS